MIPLEFPVPTCVSKGAGNEPRVVVAAEGAKGALDEETASSPLSRWSSSYWGSSLFPAASSSSIWSKSVE